MLNVITRSVVFCMSGKKLIEDKQKSILNLNRMFVIRSLSYPNKEILLFLEVDDSNRNNNNKNVKKNYVKKKSNFSGQNKFWKRNDFGNARAEWFGLRISIWKKETNWEKIIREKQIMRLLKRKQLKQKPYFNK